MRRCCALKTCPPHQFFLVMLLWTIYFLPFSYASDHKDTGKTDRKTVEAVYSLQDYTYLWKGLDQQESIARILMVPVNVVAIAFTHLWPSYYAAKAGALANTRPELHSMLKNSVHVARGVPVAMFLWPILASLTSDLKNYGWNGLAMNARHFWQCGKRRGTVPVYLKSAWLGRSFHLEVVTSYDVPPILKIKNLLNPLGSENKQTGDQLKSLPGWEHLSRVMLKHSVDHLDLQIVDVKTEKDKNKVLSVLAITPLLEKQLIISLPADGIPWDLDMLTHWCHDTWNSTTIYSLFNGKNIDSLANVLDNEFINHDKKRSEFFPVVADVVTRTNRAITVDVGDHRLPQTLAISDYSNNEHSGYIWLMDNTRSGTEISEMVNARGAESIAQDSSSQRVFDLSKSLSNLEVITAYGWVMPWMRSPLEDAVQKQHYETSDHFTVSHNEERQPTHSQYGKSKFMGLDQQQSLMKLIDRTKSKLRQTLYPLHLFIMNRLALYMINPEDQGYSVREDKPIRDRSEHSMSGTVIDRPSNELNAVDWDKGNDNLSLNADFVLKSRKEDLKKYLSTGSVVLLFQVDTPRRAGLTLKEFNILQKLAQGVGVRSDLFNSNMIKFGNWLKKASIPPTKLSTELQASNQALQALIEMQKQIKNKKGKEIKQIIFSVFGRDDPYGMIAILMKDLTLLYESDVHTEEDKYIALVNIRREDDAKRSIVGFQGQLTIRHIIDGLLNESDDLEVANELEYFFNAGEVSLQVLETVMHHLSKSKVSKVHEVIKKIQYVQKHNLDNFKLFMLTGSISETIYLNAPGMMRMRTMLLNKVEPVMASITSDRIYEEGNSHPEVIGVVTAHLSKSSNKVVQEHVDKIHDKITSSSILFYIVNAKKVYGNTSQEKKMAHDLVKGSLTQDSYRSLLSTKDSSRSPTSSTTPNKLQGWGRKQKKIYTKYYRRKIEEGKFPYDVTKYIQRDGTSHKDIINLIHFKSKTIREQVNMAALMNKRLEKAIKIYEDNKKKLKVSEQEKIKGDLEMWAAIQQTKNMDTNKDEIVNLIHKHHLAHEHISKEKLSDPEVMKALVEYMPLTSFLRHLGIISKREVLDENNPTSEVMMLVKDKLSVENVKKSRITPIKLLVALKQYSLGRGDRGQSEWPVNAAIVDKLNDAYATSFGNKTPTQKNICFAFDISASYHTTSALGHSALTCLDLEIGTIAPWASSEMHEGYSPTVLAYDMENAYSVDLKLITAMRASLKVFHDLGKSAKGVVMQVVYVLDVTASMSAEIEAAKSAIETITTHLNRVINSKTGKGMDDSPRLQVGFVAYRDHNDHDRIVTSPLTTNIKEVLYSLNKEMACGGDDHPEDIAGAFEAVTKMEWCDNTVKLIIHIADAPAHGQEYHNLSRGEDFWPDGHPVDVDPKQSMKCFASKGINYCLFDTQSAKNVNEDMQSLEKMYNIFENSFWEAVAELPVNENHPSIHYQLFDKETVLTQIPKEVCSYAVQALDIKNEEELRELVGDNSENYFERLGGEVTSTVGIKRAISMNANYDLFVIFTSSHDESFSQIPDEMEEYRDKVNKNARLVVVVLTSGYIKHEAFAEKKIYLFH